MGNVFLQNEGIQEVATITVTEKYKFPGNLGFPKFFWCASLRIYLTFIWQPHGAQYPRRLTVSCEPPESGEHKSCCLFMAVWGGLRGCLSGGLCGACLQGTFCFCALKTLPPQTLPRCCTLDFSLCLCPALSGNLSWLSL